MFIPNDWTGETVCIVASGPSLRREDVARAAHNGCRIIVINESWRVWPEADALYAADCDWWHYREPPEPLFKGQRWTCDLGWSRRVPPGVIQMPAKHSVKGAEAVSFDPAYIMTGHNSAFQALNLAVLWGAGRVIFLGLDMKPAFSKVNGVQRGKLHHHDDYEAPLRNSLAFPVFMLEFERAAPALALQGVDVINCSRETALTCFRRMRIEDALP